jgi:hypothetical protein
LLLQGHDKELVESWEGVSIDAAGILSFGQYLDGWWLLSLGESELGNVGSGGLRDELLLNGMVVIPHDLNRDFEFIKLCLHELLSAVSEEVERELSASTLHHLLALFDVCLFAVFYELPKLVREDIASLVEFFLSLIIFTKVRVFV